MSCIEELLTEKDCLSLRTIGPFQECVGSCMSQYGFQHMLCPRLLRSKGLLSVFMRDGRVRAGIRLIDSLEFAWLLGFPGIKWPRCLRTAFRVLGNCVSPIHARIVNGWIQRNWLGLPFDFDLLWNDLRRINDGNMMLADCQFFQDDEWIRWETGGSSGNLRVVDVQKVGISIQTAGKGFFFRVPFHPGLLMHQILSVVYPCDWSKIDILFRNSKTLYSLCNGDFHISVLDVCIMIDGIGWIQVSPLGPLGNIYERVLMQRGIDIRPFQLCIDDGPVDKDVLIAAFLPKNRYYLCDSLNQRFDNFLTPSVKRRRLAAGTFAAQRHWSQGMVRFLMESVLIFNTVRVLKNIAFALREDATIRTHRLSSWQYMTLTDLFTVICCNLVGRWMIFALDLFKFNLMTFKYRLSPLVLRISHLLTG